VLKTTLTFIASEALISPAIFSGFDSFDLAVMTGHFELAFPDGLAQNADADSGVSYHV